MSSEFLSADLTDDEVDAICAGYTQNAAKVRFLRGLGVEVRRKPNGRPLVARGDWVRLTVCQLPAVDRDDELPPERPSFAESPLGRWQAQQRAMKAAEGPPPKPPKLTAADRRRIAAQRAEERAAIVRFHAAKRRAARLRRTPPWADEAAIRAIYARARALTVETGIEHHVDHEVPLQGRLVSGLHVEHNLQILTGSENSRKRNRFEVG